MNSLENIIFDIRHILKANGNDSDVNTMHLAEKIHNYRARFIMDQFRHTFEIDPQWIQSISSESLTMVNSGDTPGYTGRSDVWFGKVTLPSVLSLPGKYGIIKLSPLSGWNAFYPRSQQQLQLMIESRDSSLMQFKYYFRIGNSYYFYQYSDPINADLILENPLEGYIYRTEYVPSGEILPRISYDVVEGIINYNGSNLPVNTSFAGIAGMPEFGGKGKVKFSVMKHKMDIRDPYPIDRTMAQEVIMEILTKDFQIARQNVFRRRRGPRVSCGPKPPPRGWVLQVTMDPLGMERRRVAIDQWTLRLQRRRGRSRSPAPSFRC